MRSESTAEALFNLRLITLRSESSRLRIVARFDRLKMTGMHHQATDEECGPLVAESDSTWNDEGNRVKLSSEYGSLNRYYCDRRCAASQCSSCRRFQELHTVGELFKGMEVRWRSVWQKVPSRSLADNTLMLRGPCFSLEFELHPEAFGYQAWPGLRLGLCTESSRQECCTTVLSVQADGRVVVRVDNAAEIERVIEPIVSSVVLAKLFQYEPGSRLLVLNGQVLEDAEVVEAVGKQFGSCHRLRLFGRSKSNGTQGSATIATSGCPVLRMDLNTMNHCKQRFENAVEYEEIREHYCRALWEATSEAEDAITGKKLGIVEQVVHIRTKAVITTSSMGSQINNLSWVHNIPELVHLLVKPNVRRERGGHCSQPMLVCAGPGTGKTWSMQQLAHLLARALCKGAAESPMKSDPVGLVPLLIPVLKLAQMLRRLLVKNTRSEDLPDLIQFYIHSEYSGKVRDMLEQACEMNAVIVLLDGVDEAADFKWKIEDFVIERLIAKGVPVVVTSRPEGIHVERFQQDFMVIDLCPLSEAQQLQVVHSQVEGNDFFQNLVAIDAIRRENDQIYRESFVQEDRVYLEQLSMQNHFKLPDGSPNSNMRQRVLDGSRVVQESETRRSKYLQALEMTLVGRLGELDTMLATLPRGAKAADVRSRVFMIMQGTANIKEELRRVMAGCSNVVDPARLAFNLCMLVLKLRKSGEHDVLASSLWRRIASRTDELLAAAEGFWSVFMHAAKELVREAQLEPQCLVVGPLKDPVRIYEKARDDYESRFAEGLAEANVVDVIRCMIICDDGSKMKELVRILHGGFETRVLGSPATLELVRCKNKFPAAASPTHFRHVLHNLRLTHGGSSHLVEMQVHHRKIYDHDKQSHAHEYYNFFRATLASCYEKELGEVLATLETRMHAFKNICKVPVLLSVLVCALDQHKICFPSDLFELYTSGISASLSRCLPNNDPSVEDTEEMLRTLAMANHLANRLAFSEDEVQEALTGSQRLLHVWYALRDAGEIPLVKILADGGTLGEFRFRHLSFQEALVVCAVKADSASAAAFCPTSSAVGVRLTDPTCQNILSIGARHLGEALARLYPSWSLSPVESRALTGRLGLLIGATALQSLTLDCSNNAVGDLGTLWSALGGMAQLQQLSLSFEKCSLKDLFGFERLAGMKMLRECTLNFNGSAIHNLRALGRGLGGMAQLQSLLLRFARCKALDDIGPLEALGGLKLLQECKLDFAGSAIRSIRPLGAGLSRMEKLERLTLKFAGCSSLEDAAGLEALHSLRALKECRLVFSPAKRKVAPRKGAGQELLRLRNEPARDHYQSAAIKVTRALWSGLSGIEQLETLSLDFELCAALEDLAGFQALTGLRALQECKLDLSGSGIKDLSALGPGLGGMAQLQTLSLRLAWCRALADIGVLEALGSLKMLHDCTLDLSGSAVRSVRSLGTALSGMDELLSLSLKLSGCESLGDLAGFEALGGLGMLQRCVFDFSSVVDTSATEWEVPQEKSLSGRKATWGTRLRHTALKSLRSLWLGLGGLERLQELSLQFGGCMAPEGFAGFEALAGLAALKDCDLQFQNSGIEDVRELGSGLGRAGQLEKLSLNFAGCRCLEELNGFEALAGLKRLRECDLDFSGSALLNVAALGTGLEGMQALQALRLSFKKCRWLEDVAPLEVLGTLATLKECTLDFSSIVRYVRTDDLLHRGRTTSEWDEHPAVGKCLTLQGIDAVWAGLGGAAQLEKLGLNFRKCKSLRSTEGFEELARLKALRECRLDFGGSAIKSVSALGEGLGGMEQLQSLWVRFAKCKCLEDIGALESLGGLAALRACALDFSHVVHGLSATENKAIHPSHPDWEVVASTRKSVGFHGIAALWSGLGRLEQLETLALSFKNCKFVRDSGGIRALGRLKRLRECRLDFSKSALKDLGALGIGLGGMEQLRSLALDLRGCKSIRDIGALQALRALTMLQECTLDFTENDGHSSHGSDSDEEERAKRARQRSKSESSGCDRSKSTSDDDDIGSVPGDEGDRTPKHGHMNRGLTLRSSLSTLTMSSADTQQKTARRAQANRAGSSLSSLSSLSSQTASYHHSIEDVGELQAVLDKSCACRVTVKYQNARSAVHEGLSHGTRTAEPWRFPDSFSRDDDDEDEEEEEDRGPGASDGWLRSSHGTNDSPEPSPWSSPWDSPAASRSMLGAELADAFVANLSSLPSTRNSTPPTSLMGALPSHNTSLMGALPSHNTGLAVTPTPSMLAGAGEALPDVPEVALLRGRV